MKGINLTLKQLNNITVTPNNFNHFKQNDEKQTARYLVYRSAKIAR